METYFAQRTKHGRRRRQGFTLIEIVLAIGLLVMLAGLVVINADAMLAGLGERPLPETLRKAVREARFLAAYNKEPVYLSYNRESGAFLITGAGKNVLASFPTSLAGDDFGAGVEFYQILPGRGLEVPEIWNCERRETSRVCFFPDRSSTPFEVDLRDGAYTLTCRYDPFSDAEFSPEKEW